MAIDLCGCKAKLDDEKTSAHQGLFKVSWQLLILKGVIAMP